MAQVYFHRKDSKEPVAKEALCGFVRLHVAKSTTTGVSFDIPLERLRSWNTAAKRYVVEPGEYELLVGSASDDIRARLPLTVTAL